MTMRYLPWVRRGLAAELTAVDGGGALPARATFPVTVTVNGNEAGTDLATYGPGDVTGIDIDAIVRTSPRRFSLNVAPDELAVVEFDPPDFPWMFTPAVAGSDDRLRPWLVLVVVAKVEGVTISVSQGQPLPVLTIEAPAVPTDELPDLAESWAWAHTQVVTAALGRDVASELTASPDHNISRLLCPRRLRAGASYFAALVPAFDAGVAAGFGQAFEAPEIGPAWDRSALGDRVRLPVYYHWEFSTGPAGDFESLARRLTPIPLPDGVGRTPMFIGDAHPALPALAADAGGVITMEGALRAPEAGAGDELDARHAAYVAELTDLVNATADAASNGTASDAEAVAPPIYGQWHVNVHQVPGRGRRPHWLRELNTDPRHRVAAGLGAEVVRANQEEYVDAAWAQVGDVLAANRLLDLARAMAAVATRVHSKHLAGLEPLAVLSLTSPAHSRIGLDGTALHRLVDASATPRGFASRSFRRLASPRNPHLRVLGRRAGALTGRAGNVATAGLGRALLGELAPEVSVAPDGVRTTLLPELVRDHRGLLSPELRPMVDELRATLVERSDALDGVTAPTTTVTLRPDLASTGVLLDHHLAGLRAAAGLTGDLHPRVQAVRAATIALTAGPSAEPIVGFVLAGDDVTPLTLAASGAIHARLGDRTGTLAHVDASDLVRSGIGRAREAVRTVADVLPGGLAAAVRGVSAPGVAAPPRSGPGMPSRATALPGRNVTLATDVLAEAGLTFAGPIATIDTPLPGATAVTAFVEAFTLARDVSVAAVVPTQEPPPALDLAAVHAQVLAATRPRPVIEQRALGRLRVADASFTLAAAAAGRIGVFQRDVIEPIMVGPVLERPLYLDLARFDQGRFLPGAGQIPDDVITLLETNPRFVESFLVGANHEMNRELIWRRFPGDRRATIFSRFWDHLDGSDDIAPIHTWPSASHLGHNSAGDSDGSLVLLLRGQLLRRYPNTVVYAVAATADHRIDPAATPNLPVFAGFLEPDIAFVGFDFDVTEATAGNGTMFVLQEQPTEPRFGLDVPAGGESGVPASWADLTWGHVGVDPGGFLTVGALGGTPSRPLTGDTAAVTAMFGRDAAQLAAILFQRPFRAAVHSSEIL